jgi:predicted dehydrogenase
MAMKMGKHVYCQKPLTHSVFEARLMAEIAQKNNVVTQMGNQAHAGEPIRRAVEVVRAGIIGKVTEAHIWTNRPIWDQGLKRPTETPSVPDHLDWDLWLGPAYYRPFHPSYVPFSWRGWWDFGTGALGDMACHIMDMAYWSLDLGAPLSIEAESGGGTQESPPKWSTITYQFPARGEQPPVKLVWYDGTRDGKQNLPSDDTVEGVPADKFGTILIGDKGKMYFDRGNTNWIIKPESILSDFNEPPKTIPRTKNEDHEWVQGIKGETTPLSNFSRSGPFTEMVLLGNVALRAGEKVEWDSKKLRVTNVPEANAYVYRPYRQGWSL